MAALFSLDQQIAVVTGGAKGIGKGIARVLKQAGATIIIADIDETEGKKTAEELGGSFVALDVTNQKSCHALIDHVLATHQRLDILCANVGIFPQASLEDMKESDWDLVMNINLKGMFFVAQAALKAMKKQQYGRVILTSSITGPITGFPNWAHYGASKAGQLGFMRSAALEYARFGITINAVQPGNILTEGLRAQGETYLQQMKAAVPTHTLGKPEDIGYAAAFFAAKENAYITGQSIVVDGGQILPESPEALL